MFVFSLIHFLLSFDNDTIHNLLQTSDTIQQSRQTPSLAIPTPVLVGIIPVKHNQPRYTQLSFLLSILWYHGPVVVLFGGIWLDSALIDSALCYSLSGLLLLDCVWLRWNLAFLFCLSYSLLISFGTILRL